MSLMTSNERVRCTEIYQKDELVRSFLRSVALSDPPDPKQWLEYLCRIRAIFGNLSNSISFIATLLAKRHLATRLDLGGFDAAEKAQGAPGVDIDVNSPDGRHIVAEIKTTVPYGETDFGAAQKREFQKDFDKLNESNAAHKFMFVTDDRTFELLRSKYASRIPGVCIVNLVNGEEHRA